MRRGARDEGATQSEVLQLSKELERRCLRFVRYADDVAIYVRTPKAAERGKLSVSRFITGRLKLSVNEEKSAVGRPWHSKYLGYGTVCAALPDLSVCGHAQAGDWFTRSAGVLLLGSFCQ